MIDYSLGLRVANPNETETEKKVYPYPQVRKVIDMEELADHIQEHGSPFTADIIVGVAIKLVSCIREQLLAGNKVALGKLGAFYVTFSSEGVADAEKFSPIDNIKSVNVRWDCGDSFVDLKREAQFNYVSSRKAQAENKRNEKQALNRELGVTEDNGTDGDDNGGGDQNGEITE